VNRVNPTTRSQSFRCLFAGIFEGASRTRTGDLLGAIRARAEPESRRFAGLSITPSVRSCASECARLAALSGSLPPRIALGGQTSPLEYPRLQPAAEGDLIPVGNIFGYHLTAAVDLGQRERRCSRSYTEPGAPRPPIVHHRTPGSRPMPVTRSGPAKLAVVHPEAALWARGPSAILPPMANAH
jgi:hypothetical protein